jgi:WD40 repeat protein
MTLALRTLIFTVAAFACLANTSFAASKGGIEIKKVKHKSPVDFDKEIFPFLKANCVSCHNKTTTKGELNLESPETMAKGGESGKGLVPGKGKESLVVRYAAHLEESNMPPKDNKVKAVDLTPEQLGLLALWIDQGAKASPKKERTIAWEPVPDTVKSIYAAALSPDGHYAACSRGGQISVYHIPTRQLLTQLTDDALRGHRAHRDLIPALAFSPDGKRLASGSFEEIKIWLREDQVRTEKSSAGSTPPPSPETALEVDIAATKQHLSGGKDGTAVLWDAEKKNKLKEFKHGAELNAVAISPDGTRVATSGVNNSVKLWEVSSGTMIAEVKGNRAVNDAAAAAARFAAYRKSEVDFRTSSLKSNEGDLATLQKRVTTITTDLKTAQTNVDPKVKARDEAAKAKTDLEAALPPVAAAGDATAANKRKEADNKLAEAVKKLAEAEGDVGRAHEAVAHQELELKLANEHVAKKTAEIATWKTAIAEAEKDQKAADAESKAKQDAATAQAKLARALTFSPDGLRLATATEDGQVHLWSALDGTALLSLPAGSEKPSPPRTLLWDASALSVTAEDGSRVAHKLTSQWKLERTLGGGSSPMKDRVNALEFSPDGKILAAGSGEFSRTGELTLWNVETGAMEKALPDLHKDTVLALSFTVDGRLLATGSADKAVKVLDTKTWTVTKSFEGHTAHVLGVAWRAEGRTLATSSADNSVKIWDLVSGDRKKNIEGWDAGVTSVQFVGLTGNFIAACGDKRVRLMNDSGGEVRAFPECKDFMQIAAASDDGNTVIGGGQDGILLLWNGATAKVLAQFPPP